MTVMGKAMVWVSMIVDSAVGSTGLDLSFDYCGLRGGDDVGGDSTVEVVDYAVGCLGAQTAEYAATLVYSVGLDGGGYVWICVDVLGDVSGEIRRDKYEGGAVVLGE